MFESGTRVAFNDRPDNVKLAAAVSISPIVTGIALTGTSSIVVRFAIDAIVGGSFTATTVSWNDVEVEALPSLTLTVIVVVPNWLGAGTTVTARLEPAPLKVMLPFGTRLPFDEAPDIVKLDAGVSRSPIITGIALTGVSSIVVWLPIDVSVGAEFVDTVTVNDVAAV